MVEFERALLIQPIDASALSKIIAHHRHLQEAIWLQQARNLVSTLSTMNKLNYDFIVTELNNLGINMSPFQLSNYNYNNCCTNETWDDSISHDDAQFITTIGTPSYVQLDADNQDD